MSQQMMIHKDCKYGEDSIKSMLDGIDFLANAVKITLGPAGRLVAISRRFSQGRTPRITKDGWTVANNTSPKGFYEQMGADIVREAAQKTVSQDGDGTTTSIVLAQAMCHNGAAVLKDKRVNPLTLKAGMSKAVAELTKTLRRISTPISEDTIFHVANISSNGDTEIAKLISDAVKEVGSDGLISVEEGRSLYTTSELVSGLQLQAGYLSNAFLTNVDKLECVRTNPYILLFEDKLATTKSLIPLLRQIAEAGRPLLIIAGDYEPEALQALAVNCQKGLPVCAIRIDAFGERRREVLRDIATLTGGKAITTDLGRNIESVTLEDLGQASRFECKEKITKIVDGYGDTTVGGAIEALATTLRTRIEACEEPTEKVLLQKRLSTIVGGCVNIRVGGTTDAEMKEKKDRVDDAVGAAQAASAGGIVPGGGLALVRAACETVLRLEGDEGLGSGIVMNACLAPMKQLAANAGQDGEEVLRRVMETRTDGRIGIGYNPRSRQYEDLFANGIVDPTNVVIDALTNASSVAGSVLSNGAMVVEIPEYVNVE